MNFKSAELEVEIKLTLQGNKYRAKAKICLCPFCQNDDGRKDTCDLCGKMGMIIKLKSPPKKYKLKLVPDEKK